jgi:hypothetical protein
MPKPSGQPIAKVQGLEIYVTSKPSVTRRGRDRIWVSVRQSNSKKWRVAASLCYVNAFDVRFEK